MKRIACIALHYGKEYLAWAIRGVQNAVDEIHVFYTSQPSYGHSTGAACPDSEAELRIEASRFLNKPLFWHDVTGVGSEGAHRDRMRETAASAGACMYLVVDADEVWAPEFAQQALDRAWMHNRAGRWLCNFTHFWRSFDWVVHDGFKPVRIIDMRHPITEDAYLSIEDQGSPILHFGYAQSEAVIKYKWTCHGHQNELRPNWLANFVDWQPGRGDVHPTSIGLWTPSPTDGETRALLRRLLHDHPYYGLPVIR